MGLDHKLFHGKTLAILSGGGDTPAINSSIESVRNRASILGYKVYGIRQGWKGLLGDGQVVDLTCQPYNGLYGGTALGSSRTNPFSSKEGENRVEQILRNLERYKIDVLVNYELDVNHEPLADCKIKMNITSKECADFLKSS